MLDIENAIATTFEHFDFVVETFNKAACVTVDEVVGDFIEPVLQRLDEVIETRQFTALNPSDPVTKFTLGETVEYSV